VEGSKDWGEVMEVIEAMLLLLAQKSLSFFIYYGFVSCHQG
jgi:hypothetical protein